MATLGNRSGRSCFWACTLYIDESGCTGVLDPQNPDVQPVHCVSGIILEESKIKDFTHSWLSLKERFYPRNRPISGEFLDWILPEIKGSNLRKHVQDGNRDQMRHALGVMEKTLDLFDKFGVKFLGKINVKGVGKPMNSAAVYHSAIRQLATDFQDFLESKDRCGIMILDGRNKPKNSDVSHGVFTQKFRSKGDALDRLLEMPLFGHSDNHAGLQAADILCSGFLCPMAIYIYCWGRLQSPHVHYKYHHIRDRFAAKVRNLQYRYQTHAGWRGGVHTVDLLGNQAAYLLLKT